MIDTPTARNPTLAESFGQRNGFDTIRLLAALAVIGSHAFPMTGREEPLFALTGQATLGSLAVSIFFVISGLLIPMSYDRGSLSRYVTKRAKRIMPALVVAVVFCAFVLGPIFTSMPLNAYFSAKDTWRFLGQALFLPVSYDLPGVFDEHPLSTVNGSLWSLKFEIACYALVVLALTFRPFRKISVIVAWLLSFVVVRAIPGQGTGTLFFVDQFADLFRFFGAGMIFYLFAGRIQLRAGWAWLAFAVFVAGCFTPFFLEIACTAGAYALIVFAYGCPEWFSRLTETGDISYGVYVYGFPVQQILVPPSLAITASAPALAPFANMGLAMIPVFIAGVLSWLVVEKPVMLFKPRRITRPSLAS